MSRKNEHWALITGASKGIGKALATELAKGGTNILAAARSADKLKALVTELKDRHGVRADFLSVDLLADGAERKLADWVKEHDRPVDILVNNAGQGLWGRFAKLDLDEQRRMMHLNMDSLIAMTHTFLPLLLERQRAWVLNVGSTSGYQAVSTTAVYSATKAFVNTFTRGLRQELRNTNVSVTLLAPGATESEFTKAAGMQEMQETADKFNMPAETVAKITVRAMFRGKAEVIPGFANQMGYLSAKFMPKALVERVAGNMFEKKLPDDR